MKQRNTKSTAIERIVNSGGKFLGLYTKDGRVFNAQFRHETPHYIRVYDRNRKSDVTLSKNSIMQVRG